MESDETYAHLRTKMTAAVAGCFDAGLSADEIMEMAEGVIFFTDWSKPVEAPDAA